MTAVWSNWSGSLQFQPRELLRPKSEDDLAAIVRAASKLRIVGSGHSSSPLVQTEETLVSLERLTGLVSCDAEKSEALVWAGTKLEELGRSLHKHGLALHNYGDIDQQTVAGAFSTGTHGSGRTLQNLPAALLGARVVLADGSVQEWSIERDREMIAALQVSLGVLGTFSTLRLRVQPAYDLERREWCTHIDECLAHVGELIAENRNFDFYWYPRSEEAKLRTLNFPGQGPAELPFAKCIKTEVGPGHEVLPRNRDLRFEEMEYALPAEAGVACFQEVRRRVKERHRKTVAWRVLFRTVAADDALLSPASGRDTVTISILQNATLPYEEYFNDIEPIFRAHGGRPHWGKIHNLKAAELRPLYPGWDRFAALREQLDPSGKLLNGYTRALLGVADSQQEPHP